MFPYILQGLTLGLAAGAQPGPFQTYIITQTLANGWRKTLIAAFAPLVSDGPIILLAFFVLKQMPDALQRGLYIAGGLFILYLSWSSFQQWRSFDENAEKEVSEQSLWKAAMMNLISPGPYIFWSLVSGPILLKGLAEAPSKGIGFIVAFYGTMISLNLVLIVLVGAASKIGERIRRGLLLFASIALSLFGIYQLWLGIVVR
ncbi:MAG: LysE family transporter [Anaerolineae bacterium]|jgi:threonine/homoserine/homoserine lactone efflux protein|nr:LysE family transporter [Anaerolineae bacterium]MBT7072753.1 LysE family transporter [Anaerolineae bacterium]MBT7324636.1 LysE family transporter [Anaerolineae bacterium]